MMPTFEPVGIFYTQEQFSRTDGRSSVIWTYRHKPLGEQLFTESKIQQAYEAGKRDAVAEWLPIDTAPQHGEFLVYMPADRRPIDIASWHPNMKVIGGQFSFDRKPVTHWTPLPNPPKGENHG